LSNIKVSLTCFNAHSDLGVSCKKTSCKHWISSEKFNNCTVIAAKVGPMTLQEIGEIFDVTRMRICQIEKSVMQKMSTSLTADLE
jgi:uncharacterized protein YqkB